VPRRRRTCGARSPLERHLGEDATSGLVSEEEVLSNVDDRGVTLLGRLGRSVTQDVALGQPDLVGIAHVAPRRLDGSKGQQCVGNREPGVVPLEAGSGPEPHFGGRAPTLVVWDEALGEVGAMPWVRYARRTRTERGRPASSASTSAGVIATSSSARASAIAPQPRTSAGLAARCTRMVAGRWIGTPMTRSGARLAPKTTTRVARQRERLAARGTGRTPDRPGVGGGGKRPRARCLGGQQPPEFAQPVGHDPRIRANSNPVHQLGQGTTWGASSSSSVRMGSNECGIVRVLLIEEVSGSDTKEALMTSTLLVCSRVSIGRQKHQIPI